MNTASRRIVSVFLFAFSSLSYAMPVQDEQPSLAPMHIASSQTITLPKASKNLLAENTTPPPPKPSAVKNIAPPPATVVETKTVTQEEVASGPIVTTTAQPVDGATPPAPPPAAPPVPDTGLSDEDILTVTVGGGVDFFAQKRQLDNAGVPFIALAYNFTKHWGIQMFYGIFNTDSQNASAGKPRVHGAIFAFDGLYRFGAYKTVEPYVLFGAGIIGLSYNNNDADNQGNINAGLGVQYFINKRFTLSLEGRDFYTTVGGKNDILLDAGINMLFDIG